jgi:hypothetical protein
MALAVLQIDRHIAVLEEFEQRYGEYLGARRLRGTQRDPGWSERE